MLPIAIRNNASYLNRQSTIFANDDATGFLNLICLNCTHEGQMRPAAAITIGQGHQQLPKRKGEGFLQVQTSCKPRRFFTHRSKGSPEVTSSGDE
jgi:hypothetical protein